MDSHTHIILTHTHTHTLEETWVCLALGQVSGRCQPSEQQADEATITCTCAAMQTHLPCFCTGATQTTQTITEYKLFDGYHYPLSDFGGERGNTQRGRCVI